MTTAHPVTRRACTAALGVAAGAAVSAPWLLPKHWWLRDRRPARSRVALLRTDKYSEELEDLLFRGLRLFGLDVKGKCVLLKPNLVECIPGVEVNTNPRLVGAAIDAFRRLGAGRVIVAEGPGHQRDTELVLAESGLGKELRLRGAIFIDLNRDAVVRLPTKSDYSGLRHLLLPRTLLSADVVVSMPKVKTHHWAGVTLSMKNMFGVIPGVAYGWPKNVLHWRGIHESILDICSTVPIHFVIADGIVAMEGNGPLHGSHRELGKVILADDAVAADFTCCRLMGLRPDRVPHLATAAHWLGNGDGSRIAQLGEALPAKVRPFAVLREFAGLVDI